MSISFERAAGYYDRTRGYPPEVQQRVGRALLDAAGATEHTRVLELGVGTGRIALPIIRAGYHYTGIDLSTAMMDRLRAALGEMPDAGRVTLVEGDAEHLPFADATFDAVLTVHVYHLVGDPERVATESARVLARPGVLLNGRDDAGTRGEGARREIAGAWAEILRGLGWETPRDVSYASSLTVAPLWESLGARVDEIDALEWDATGSPAEVVDGYAERLWSSLWGVPETIYPAAIESLHTWAMGYYGAAYETQQSYRRRFVIERGRLQ